MNIIWNPKSIEARSMEIIEPFLQGHLYSQVEKTVVSRVIHATGDPSIIDCIKIHPAACRAGMAAIQEGRQIFTDVNMLLAGINHSQVEAYGGSLNCSISTPLVAEAALDWHITRAAAAMRLWGGQLNHAIVAIGNAPTALFELLDLIEKGTAQPAVIIGTPVGFVGAAESKALLVEKNQVPYFTVTGTRGGSPMAAAMLNALLYFKGDVTNG